MRLRACDPETAHNSAIGLDVTFEAGEERRVEISTKFDPADISDELIEAGFGDIEFLTDAAGDFGSILTRRA